MRSCAVWATRGRTANAPGTPAKVCGGDATWEASAQGSLSVLPGHCSPAGPGQGQTPGHAGPLRASHYTSAVVAPGRGREKLRHSVVGSRYVEV